MEVVTLLKWAFTFASFFLIFGCADPIDGAKNTLEAKLFNNYEVEYRDTRRFPGDVVCGEANATGKWGRSTGYKRFIVRADRADTAPSKDDLEIFCSEDPAAALQAKFGIDLMDNGNGKLQTVQRQLIEMDLALRHYLSVNKDFPLSAQELLSVSTTGAQSQSPDEGAYIDKIPEDPWGRLYHYEKLRQLHPAPKGYKLYTLGRDGAAGGTGEDADIGNWHLRYLDHIGNL
jgi:type II secretion system protein G